MPKDQKTDPIKSNPKWAAESEKIKSIQLAFDFDLAIDTAVRLAAARKHMPPSAIVRETLGLAVNAPSRSRISVSLSNDDLSQLAKRYNLESNDRAQIKSCIDKEISDTFADEDNIEHIQAELDQTRAQIRRFLKESEKLTQSMKPHIGSDTSGKTK